jgi:hypothetical protein
MQTPCMHVTRLQKWEVAPSNGADAKWQRQRGGKTQMDDPTDNNDSDDEYNNDNVDK